MAKQPKVVNVLTSYRTKLKDGQERLRRICLLSDNSLLAEGAAELDLNQQPKWYPIEEEGLKASLFADFIRTLMGIAPYIPKS